MDFDPCCNGSEIACGIQYDEKLVSLNLGRLVDLEEDE
jgi:hypothetical protein